MPETRDKNQIYIFLLCYRNRVKISQDISLPLHSFHQWTRVSVSPQPCSQPTTETSAFCHLDGDKWNLRLILLWILFWMRLSIFSFIGQPPLFCIAKFWRKENGWVQNLLFLSREEWPGVSCRRRSEGQRWAEGHSFFIHTSIRVNPVFLTAHRQVHGEPQSEWVALPLLGHLRSLVDPPIGGFGSAEVTLPRACCESLAPVFCWSLGSDALGTIRILRQGGPWPLASPSPCLSCWQWGWSCPGG